MPTPVKIDVWSDIACPWCYIGKRKFEQGVRDANVAVEVEYHSFELSPDTPLDFEGDEAAFLAEHKGIAIDEAQSMLDRVTAIAGSVGLGYRFADVHHTKTLLAHELLHAAKAQGKQLETAEALFRAYFVEGGHVGRLDDLLRIAASVGLDADETRAALTDHRFADDVQADIEQAAAFGISGVPFFVVDGRYGISGAQAPEVFAGALAQVAAESAAPVSTTSAEAR